MTQRLYIIPIQHLTLGAIDQSVPKYLSSPRFYDTYAPLAGLENVPYTWESYIKNDAGILLAEVDAAQHALLDGQADVLTIPPLDNTVGNATVRNRVRDVLEGFRLPGTWVSIGMTYRQILRVVLGVFEFHNHFVALVQGPLFEGLLDLDSTVADIPLAKRNKLQNAADAFGLDYSSVTGSTTIRELLRLMGAQFATHQYVFSNNRVGLSLII